MNIAELKKLSSNHFSNIMATDFDCLVLAWNTRLEARDIALKLSIHITGVDRIA